jgi:hypothetical protein
MRQRADAGLQHPKAARHAEVHDGRAGIAADENVFGAALDGADGLAAKGALETRRDRPPQPPLADDDVEDAMPDQRGRDPAPGGLDFG